MVGAPAFVACSWTATAAEGSTSYPSCCYAALVAAAETTSTAVIAAGSEGATAHGAGGGALEVGVVHAGTLKVEVVGSVCVRFWKEGESRVVWTYSKMSDLAARVAATIPCAGTADT